MNSTRPLVALRDVTLRFDDNVILDHVDFNIAPCERLVIIGPSGTGKSTLLRLLVGTLRPDAGSIYIKGRDITRIPAPGGDLYRYDLTPEVSDAELITACQDIDADFILCGHTHFPFVRKLGSKVFINPGAVALQHDGNWRASYAIWDDGKVKLHRVKYDDEKCAGKLRASKLPPNATEQLARIIETGKGP